MPKYNLPEIWDDEEREVTLEELKKAYLFDEELVDSRKESNWEDDDFDEWFEEGLMFGWIEEI